MPRPAVTASSRKREIPRRWPDDPAIDSPDTAADSRGWEGLSYLHGAVDTNDMGCPDNSNFDFARWERMRELRRHTTEQGSSTFSWPRKP